MGLFINFLGGPDALVSRLPAKGVNSFEIVPNHRFGISLEVLIPKFTIPTEQISDQESLLNIRWCVFMRLQLNHLHR